MDQLYKKTLDYYTRAVEKIRTDNTALVDSLGSSVKARHAGLERCRARQSLIPYVKPDPKTNFLAITPINLYTEDDPVLRYVPNIKIDQPAAITWYDDTLIGSQPMNAMDAIDALFLAGSASADGRGAVYLKSIGRKPQPSVYAQQMEDLFCAVCCMFDCGIHKVSPHKLLRFDERKACCCGSKHPLLIDPDQLRSLKDPQAMLSDMRVNCARDRRLDTLREFYKMLALLDDFPSPGSSLGAACSAGKAENESLCFRPLENVRNGMAWKDGADGAVLAGSFSESLRAELGDSFLRPCVLKRILEIGYGGEVACLELKAKDLPIKRCKVSRRAADPHEFYEPCDHGGACTKARCGCSSRGTSCEMSCACTSCDNMKFCSCLACGMDCPCYAACRDCSDLCMCARKDASSSKVEMPAAPGERSHLLGNYAERLLISAESLCALRPKILSCSNRNVQNRTALQVSVCESKRHGYGLFSECFIKEGSFVIEYTGEIISDKEAERRGNFYELNRCSYLFNLVNKGGESLYSVDAYYTGNMSRYINHSKRNANLRSEVATWEGRAHIVFYSIRDIYKGEELLFDYHFTEAHKKEHGIID